MSRDSTAPVYATRGLVEVLCELAADAEPGEVSVALAATPAGDLDVDLPPETPVLTDFYMPRTAESVTRVFGVDLSIPAGQTHGRFVSHPQGDLEVSLTDDLAAVMLVAVPPWEADAVTAFDRSGRRLPLELVDAEPPQEALG